MLFVCLAAMFMTGSRAGVVLSLLALTVAFTLYFRGDLPLRTGRLTALFACAAIALVLLQFLGAGVNARFDAQGLADGGRLSTYLATLRMIGDHPWLGTGLGTFAWSYPAYRPSDVSLWGVWDRAHNTLLEIASEMGVPIAVLVALGWAVALWVLARGATSQSRNGTVVVAALSVIILVLLHSFVDFPLQITGYAIVVFALVGAGLAQSFHTADSRKRVYSKNADRREMRPPIGRGGENSC
jgi:O-antigen ligase